MAGSFRRGRLVPLMIVLAGLSATSLSPSSVQAADLANGQRVYLAHCAGCHGAGGLSIMPQVPSFARGERLNQPDPVLAATVRTGRGAMPPFFGILSEREILDVVGFLRTF